MDKKKNFTLKWKVDGYKEELTVDWDEVESKCNREEIPNRLKSVFEALCVRVKSYGWGYNAVMAGKNNEKLELTPGGVSVDMLVGFIREKFGFNVDSYDEIPWDRLRKEARLEPDQED